MIITQAQGYQYALNAGFSPQSAQIISAIMMAESGGDSTSVNTADPNGGSFGPLQINGAHFGESWPGGIMTQLSAQNPQTAFQFAFWLSQGGTKFTDWGTFTDGRYRQFLGTSGAGSTSGSVPSSLASQSTTLSATQSTGLQTFMAWLSSPARIAKMVMGISLIALGVIALVKPETISQVSGGVL